MVVVSDRFALASLMAFDMRTVLRDLAAGHSVDKPHRVLLDRRRRAADEAAAYLRRRRMSRQPFARVYWPGGRGADFAPDTEAGRTCSSPPRG